MFPSLHPPGASMRHHPPPGMMMDHPPGMGPCHRSASFYEDPRRALRCEMSLFNEVESKHVIIKAPVYARGGEVESYFVILRVTVAVHC